MPAPTRPTPHKSFIDAINVPKGIVGVYTDAEVDSLIAPILYEVAAVNSNLSQYLIKSDLDLLESQLQAIATTTQDTLTGLEKKADKTTVSALGTTLMDAIMEVGEGSYKKEETYTKNEVDSAIAGIVTGDLSQEQIDAIISQVGPVDLSNYALLDSYGQVITANQVKAETFKFTKANTTIGYTRFPDYPMGRLGIEIGGPGGELQFIAYVSDLSEYAKSNDNTQNIVANATVAKGYTFGDSISTANPGLVYTDTGEGYGPRLVLDTPGGRELIPYQSDFEPIKARLTTLESKGAPNVDLSTTASKESVDLLRSQVQIIFDSIYTRQEADARYYTQKQTEDRFMRIEKAFSKDDFDNQMALFLYSRKQVDDKLTAISPLGSPSINDPALADFKKSVLDEVKKLMSGGKTVPDDMDWTVCPQVAGAGTIEARVLNGVLQLRGELTISISATGSFTLVRRLPANFPKPLDSYNCLVYGIQTGSTYRRVFVRWSTSGDIAICPDGTMTAATLTGATAYAY